MSTPEPVDSSAVISDAKRHHHSRAGICQQMKSPSISAQLKHIQMYWHIDFRGPNYVQHDTPTSDLSALSSE